MTQYLNKEELLTTVPPLQITTNDLVSTDTYNETKILQKYLSLDNDARILLYKAAIQLSIIGYGNKNYGFIRVNNTEVLPLKTIFDRYNVKYNEKLGMKYTDDELSARRLIRLLRYQTQEFIIRNNRPSYLWLKYSDKNVNFIGICFPGGEHLVEDKDSGLYLLKTYGRLDQILNTRFVERLKRIYIARGLFLPLEIEQIIANLNIPTSPVIQTTTISPTEQQITKKYKCHTNNNLIIIK